MMILNQLLSVVCAVQNNILPTAKRKKAVDRCTDIFVLYVKNRCLVFYSFRLITSMDLFVVPQDIIRVPFYLLFLALVGFL